MSKPLWSGRIPRIKKCPTVVVILYLKFQEIDPTPFQEIDPGEKIQSIRLEFKLIIDSESVARFLDSDSLAIDQNYFRLHKNNFF